MKLLKRYLKLINKILSLPAVVICFWLNRFYIFLRLSNEQFEINSRFDEFYSKEWQKINLLLKQLKVTNTDGQYSHIIRVLSAIMPDTYAKCYYLKKLYERGGNDDKK